MRVNTTDIDRYVRVRYSCADGGTILFDSSAVLIQWLSQMNAHVTFKYIIGEILLRIFIFVNLSTKHILV